MAESKSASKTVSKVYPVILSGGAGTRLWPKSRTLFPKQFHNLTSEHTLLQEALLRVKDPTLYANPIIVCNEDHRFVAAEQAQQLGITLQDIVLEPEGRNTAPAVAVAAALIRQLDPDGLVLVLASDHHIGDLVAFTDAVRLGVPAAVAGYVCTFGISPIAPETGYGYIKRTSEEVTDGVFKIDQFKEKPDLETAKTYLADGSYAWNAGLFLFAADQMLKELDVHEPSIVPACEEAIKHGKRDGDLNFLRLSGPHFAKAKAMSLDYALMEPTKLSCVIPLDAQWTDVGSWPSLFQTCVTKDHNSEENKANNVYTHGEVVQSEVKNCYLSTDGPLLAAIGCDNLCVVATEDAVLVLPMDKAQSVGKLAKKLKKNPATAHLAVTHLAKYKPWGVAKSVAKGPRFKVIQLTINPGAATSLQMHFHRAMHHIVVSGTALFTRGDETFMLSSNQSSYVGIGISHRLHNPGKSPLVVIEVQSGDYLADDDIVRINDPFFSTSEEYLVKSMSSLTPSPARKGSVLQTPASLAPAVPAYTPAPVPSPPAQPDIVINTPSSVPVLLAAAAGVALGVFGVLAAGYEKVKKVEQVLR